MPFPYLHASSPLFRPVFCVLPQRPCVHYTELFVGFVGRSLTKPAQIVDIFLSAWDFSCVFISERPKTCCRSAFFFQRMAASEYDLYLHSIIHISCLVFFGRMKYNKKCYRRYECRACLAAPNKYRNISRLAQEEMW